MGASRPSRHDLIAGTAVLVGLVLGVLSAASWDDGRLAPTASDRTPSGVAGATPDAEPYVGADDRLPSDTGFFEGELGQAEPSTTSRGPKRLTVTVRSGAPIGKLAYVIPTSEKGRGTATVRARSWSITTTVRGPADHAQVYVQAGYEGDPVTCTVTVDGVVTDRRTAKGRFDVAMCQG